MDPNAPAIPPNTSGGPQHPTAPGFEQPQRATRPDGTASSTFSATPPEVLKTGQQGVQESNMEAAVRKEANLGDNRERQAASARAAAGLDPNGSVLERPDISYHAAERDAAAARPLGEGVIFRLAPANGQGAGLTATVMKDGSLAIAMQPDKGNPISIRLAGEPLDAFRKAVG